MPELRKGLLWRLDSIKPKDVLDELTRASACHVIRLGTSPMSAYAGKAALTLIIQAINMQPGKTELVSETKRYLAGMHIMSGGSMLPYDILLTEDLV